MYKRQEYGRILADKAYVDSVLKSGAERAARLANRFNGIYGDTFALPAGYVPKAGAKIMSLAEPTKKMSKSDTNANAFVLMTDDKDTIVRKFKRAVTDSDGVVRFDAENKPGVSNLSLIHISFPLGANFRLPSMLC